jgi:succinate-semialdehyde dehydrogenase / glutarate-semialdehyde dehydrogenase
MPGSRPAVAAGLAVRAVGHCSLMTRTTDAVARARSAAATWRRTPPAERAERLGVAAEALRLHDEDLALLLSRTTGRLLGEARASVGAAAGLLAEAAVSGLTPPVSGRRLLGDPAAVDYVATEPHGVVGVITPWNDPYPAAAGLIAAALVTGNTVVHKASERSALPGSGLSDVIGGALPDGVLVHLDGGPETGRELAECDDVDLVAHIGSSAAGESVRRACARRDAVSITENGGNDPVVVDAGVDPRWAAGQVAVGAFTNAGQLCSSVERVYVHESVADAFVEELVRRAEALVVGAPTDEGTTMGPLVDERAVASVDAQVRDALDRGARARTGGHLVPRVPHGYAPTVLVDCTDDMLVMREETFGPVAPVVVVGSWEEGLERAAAGRFGLGATVLTRDHAHAMTAVESLDVGTVRVNAVFGGAPGGSADPRRASGRGVGFGPDLLRQMVRLKVVHIAPCPTEVDR